MIVVCPFVVRHGCIVAKWYKIGHRLLLITIRKLHIGLKMTCKSLTLDALKES